jgi:hypothetical protein
VAKKKAMVMVALEVAEDVLHHSEMGLMRMMHVEIVRNKTLTLIEREDDTTSWGNFLFYFSHSTTMPCPLRGWEYILIGC